MEKQRIKRQLKSGRRFLIILLAAFFSLSLTAQSLSLEQINALRIIPEEGQKLYTKTDIKFIVTIPNVHSSQVQILSTDQQQEVTFRTIRKSESYEENGTSIEIWYNFNKKGNYTLKPLSVMIQNRRRSIAFENITLTDDPAKMLPRIVLVFEDGTTVYSDEPVQASPLLKITTGKKLNFTVNLQYANQLMQFNWEIPKDSIFTCVKEFEFTEARPRERVYSHDLIPVAAFEWTGLIPGKQKVPAFRLNATGYNGYRSELYLPEIQIEFTQSDTTDTVITEDDIFSSAFYQEAQISDTETNIILTKQDCQTLADLYTREHNEFLMYNKARQARIAFEAEYGIVSSVNPIFPTVLLYISLIVIAASIVCIIIAARKKHKIRALFFTTILLIGTALFIYCTVRRNEHYGICSGCKIYSIPQENAEAVSEVSNGMRVRILERTGKWYYIQVGESGGWCNIDEICIIR